MAPRLGKTTPVAKGTIGEAVFSADAQYRYSLFRQWNQTDSPRLIMFICMNPSSANENEDDPTVVRVQRRAKALGYDGCYVMNLWAYRATDPPEMTAHYGGRLHVVDQPNVDAIRAAIPRCEAVVCAWGSDGGTLGNEMKKLLQEWGVKPKVLKLCKNGQPWHPLYLKYSLAPIEWDMLTKS